MENEPVRKERPILLRDELHQDRLDFFRIGLAGEAEPGGEARDVGIDHHADVDAVGVSENDVGGFASDAGELHERVHGCGNFSVVVLDEELAAGADVFGLVAVEADGAEVVFERGGIGVGVVAGGAIILKERGRDFVDLHVGALRGENGGDEKLERAGESQFAMRVWINLGQGVTEGFCAFGGGEFFHRKDLATKEHKENKREKDDL